MAFTIDEAFLPATLTARPMTDEEFAAFCAEHPDLFFEMTAEGEIVVMPPNFTLTGIRNRAIIGPLDRWAMRDGRGTVGDSSAGFVLPNGARRSPDASWIPLGTIGKLDRKALEGYWHLCPAFVIELRSKSDLPLGAAGQDAPLHGEWRAAGMADQSRTRSVELPARSRTGVGFGCRVGGRGGSRGWFRAGSENGVGSAGGLKARFPARRFP